MDTSYLDYWDTFLNYMKNHPQNELNLSRKNQGRYYYVFSLGVGSCEISFSVSPKKKYIGCELYLKGKQAKQVFTKLSSQKKIKLQLPTNTEWQLLPEKTDCRIISTISVDFNDKNKWESYFDWYRTTGILYTRIFTKYLKHILSSSEKEEELKKKYYLPTKDDCDIAIKELYNEGQKGDIDNVLDRIEKNITSQGFILKSNWRIITEENMKIWSC